MRTVFFLIFILSLSSCGEKIYLPDDTEDLLVSDNLIPNETNSTQETDVGTYTYTGESNSKLNFSCANYDEGLILKIRTGIGGLVLIEKEGEVVQEIYLEAYKKVDLKTQFQVGEFTVSNSERSKTKKCRL